MQPYRHPFGDHGGMTREFMPQISRNAYPKFFDYLIDRGIPYEEIDCPIGMIKCTQSDVYMDKIRSLMDKFDGLGSNDIDRNFIISSDYYLLDGHHNFLAYLFKGNFPIIPAIRVGIKMDELLMVAHDFLGWEILKENQIKLSEEEVKHFRVLRKAYREMYFYQKKARNPQTLYAKKKFLESYKSWNSAVRNVRRTFELNRAKEIIGHSIKQASRSTK